jgi:hypothetical protein
MVQRRRLTAVVGALGGLFCAQDTRATYHLMQIEVVIGGVEGDLSAQAIQLRMRASDQREVHVARLVAWDANGENPVVLVDFGPPFPDALPTQTRSALRFPGLDSAMSNNSAADYVITSADAVVINNARQSFTVTSFSCPEDSAGDADGDA